ncbi:O-antigen ligase family protein [Variovorax sp. RT4R15]|uniref:O-antigen ligase family protein n=1 Tax=Variovorax sp. RT4R15 TaxID=3443737 RepID=UPI003F48FB40
MPVPSQPVPDDRKAVQIAAFLWGFVVFMPVGLNYLGIGVLLGSLALSGGWRERAERLRAHALWWPLLALAAWVLIVLLIRPHHEETGLSLWHDARIVLTLAMPLLLSVEEAVWGIRGFLLAALGAALVIALTHTVAIPDLHAWHNVAVMKGNKSINNALLLALVGATAATWGLVGLRAAPRRWARLATAGAIVLGAGVAVTFALPSRTSVLALLLAILGACVHQWRGSVRTAGLAMGAALLLAAAAFWSTPSLGDKFRLGIQEVAAANAGTVSEGSWVVRYFMYRETASMLMDQPLAGNGLGSWTPEWHRRSPALLHDYSMPHDDFLWLGAETGFPGLATLLAIMIVALALSWFNPTVEGRLAWAAMLVLFAATLVNSALRDAAIGLSLPWIAMLYLRLASAPAQTWARIVPAAWIPRAIR